MALKLWFPLTGDTRNNGLHSSTVTSSNLTYSNDGKIGKCCNFTTGSYILGTQSFLTNSTEDWSYCCWMNLTSGNAGQCLFSCRNSVNSTGISIFYYGTQWFIDDGARWRFTPTNTIAVNTWYHICVVRKKGVGVYLYVNGELDSSTSVTHTPTDVCTTNFSVGSSQGTATTINGNSVQGALNDVRVYDHALSVKEIKEIAKGLVCHYTMTNTESTLTNNILYDSSGYCNNGVKYGTFSVSSDSARCNMSTTFNGSDSYVKSDSLPAETKTISFWLKTTWGTSTVQKVVMVDVNSHIGFGITSAGRFLLSCGINGSGYSSKMYSATATGYVANKWNHIVIIKVNDTERKLYVNGVLQTPLSNTSAWIMDMNNLLIGCRYRSSSGLYETYFDGQLSDFRVYTTELTESDILDLYNKPISISKTGETYTQGELLESDIDHVRFQKTGVIESDGETDKTSVGEHGFLEYNDITRIYKAGYMQSVDFNEY